MEKKDKPKVAVKVNKVVVNPRLKQVVKATADSTNFFKKKLSDTDNKILKQVPNLPKRIYKKDSLQGKVINEKATNKIAKNNLESIKMKGLVSERKKDVSNLFRQGNKGKPGYDKNGNLIKK